MQAIPGVGVIEIIEAPQFDWLVWIVRVHQADLDLAVFRESKVRCARIDRDASVALAWRGRQGAAGHVARR